MENSTEVINKDLPVAEIEQKAPPIVRIVSIMIPIIGLYIQFPFVMETVGLTLAVVLSIACLFFGKSIKMNKPFTLFSLFYIARMFLNFFMEGASFSRPMIMSFAIILASTFCILILPNFVDKELLFKSWRIIGIIVVLMIFYQFALINFAGQYVTPIRIWPGAGEGWYDLSNRPSAVFTEPAMAAVFLSPLLLMALERRRYWLAIIVSVGLLLSTSTVGVISLAILWVGFLILSKQIQGSQRVLLIGLVVFLGLLFFNASAFSPTIEKLTSEVEGSNGHNSYVRVEMGYDYYKQLTPVEKVCGIFYQNVRSLIMSGRIHLQINLKDSLYSYVNTAQLVLITTGLIGAIFYVISYYRMQKHATDIARIYILMQFALIFGSKNFYGAIYLIPFIFIFSQNDAHDCYELKIR